MRSQECTCRAKTSVTLLAFPASQKIIGVGNRISIIDQASDMTSQGIDIEFASWRHDMGVCRHNLRHDLATPCDDVRLSGLDGGHDFAELCLRFCNADINHSNLLFEMTI
jgi:hypothetical protein